MIPAAPNFGAHAARPTALHSPPDSRHTLNLQAHDGLRPAVRVLGSAHPYEEVLALTGRDVTRPQPETWGRIVLWVGNQLAVGGGPPPLGGGGVTGYQRPSRRSIVPLRAWTCRSVESAAGRACWMSSPISCEVSPGRSRTRASARSVFMFPRRVPLLVCARTTRRRCTDSVGAALVPETLGARLSDSSLSRSTAISSLRCSPERRSTAETAASKRRLATRYSCTILSAWPMQRVVAAHASRATRNSNENNYLAPSDDLGQVNTWGLRRADQVNAWCRDAQKLGCLKTALAASEGEGSRSFRGKADTSAPSVRFGTT